VQLGRAYALSGDKTKAKSAYQAAQTMHGIPCQPGFARVELVPQEIGINRLVVAYR
jgi:hypothetical protein